LARNSLLPTPIYRSNVIRGEASHHRVTEARPEQQFGKQRREIFKAFWCGRVIIIYASTHAPSQGH
jgi:hypothetical protein